MTPMTATTPAHANHEADTYRSADFTAQPEAPAEAFAAPFVKVLLQRMQHDRASLASALEVADRATRQRLISHLQDSIGNARTQAVLAQRRVPKLSVQRYKVPLAADTPCDEVVDWMTNSNPYASEGNAALTTVGFKWKGSFKITGKAPDFKLGVSKASVVETIHEVDMPKWKSSDPATQKAWSSMYGALRKHEARHEKIGADWRLKVLGRLNTLSIPVTAADKSDVSSQAPGLVDAEWNKWIAEYNEAQVAIDPYMATLTCPAPKES